MTAGPTPAERLTAAAETLDRLASKAAFGWGGCWTARAADQDDPEWSAVDAPGKRDMVGCEDPDVTALIATMDPATVSILASMLRSWARMVRRDSDLIYRVGGAETLAVADAVLSATAAGSARRAGPRRGAGTMTGPPTGGPPAAAPGARWDTHEVGWTAAGGWSCGCGARQPCPHVRAVQAHDIEETPSDHHAARDQPDAHLQDVRTTPPGHA